MSDSDPFLTRWSRRKSEAANTPAQPSDASKANASKPAAETRPDATQPTPVSNEKVSDKRATAGKVEQGLVEQGSVKQGLDFDPANLPSIDSIGPKTDISAFLKPGVPSHLRHAALRRAWSTDPEIRDFKGLQENDWNFNDPNGIPGFGELSPHTDVKKMLQALFGEAESEPTTAAEVPPTIAQAVPKAVPKPREVSGQSEGATEPEKSGSVRRDSAIRQSGDATDDKMVQSNNDGAVQDQEDKAAPAEGVLRRRTHGGALPQ